VIFADRAVIRRAGHGFLEPSLPTPNTLTASTRGLASVLVLGPTKPFPRVGAPALIAHFGGPTEAVTIVGVEDDGRRVVVSSGDGRHHEFTLRRATAAFVLAGEQHAPRLRLAG
jgi:hypothetical protein